MVEAGLGVSLVPLMPNGEVTRGVNVGVRKLPPKTIEPIDSGILIRRGETPHPAAEAFMRFLMPGSDAPASAH
jgi:DNA-binding transcriptional LysR family regulator